MKERKDDTARQLTLGIYSKNLVKLTFIPRLAWHWKAPHTCLMFYFCDTNNMRRNKVTRRVILLPSSNWIIIDFHSLLFLFTFFSLSSRFVSRMMVVRKEKNNFNVLHARWEKRKIGNKFTSHHTMCHPWDMSLYRCCSKEEEVSLIYSPETIIFIWRAMNRRKHLHKNGIFFSFWQTMGNFLLSHRN